MDKRIVLASSSPRRIELLKREGLQITVIPADIDESLPDDIGPEEAVKSLALKKASYVANTVSTDVLSSVPIIAADTVVYLNSIIGKPRSREDALRILMDLSGKEHYVYTGVAIITSKQKVFCEETRVVFKDYSPADLEDYLSTEEPYDKAGAYAIQGYFSRFIDHIDGDYDNVVGLPVTRLLQELQNL